MVGCLVAKEEVVKLCKEHAGVVGCAAVIGVEYLEVQSCGWGRLQQQVSEQDVVAQGVKGTWGVLVVVAVDPSVGETMRVGVASTVGSDFKSQSVGCMVSGELIND